MTQRFYASPHDTFVSKNGAVGYRPGGPMDCLGPYAKVKNCPIYKYVDGIGYVNTGVRLTCYAQNYANSYWTVPAATRRKGKRIRGYFIDNEDVGGCVFVISTDDWRLLE